MKAKRIVWLVLSFSVLLLLLTGCQRNVGNHSEIQQVVPQQQNEQGVALDSQFQLLLSDGMSEEQIRNQLQIVPHLEYTLQKADGGWTLIPASALKEDEVYTFRVKDSKGNPLHSFAFQTQSPLKVVSTYPQDGGYLWDDNGIEIAFNKNIAGSASQLLQITPQVEGVTKVKGKKLVFYPTQSFEEGKGYQVTVKQGVTALTGEQLEEDYRMTLKVSSRNEKITISEKRMETFLPGDLTVAQLYGEYKGVLKTDLYRFSDAEDYIRAAKQVNATVRYDKISHNRLDPKQFSVEEYTSFEQMPLSQENYSLKSLILPDGMEEGWYLADISIPDGEENDWVQKLIQITNTSVYTQSLGGKLLVWLNDADTHQPMAGCTVQISDCKSDRTVEGVTDAQGMVTIETGEMADGWLSVRKDDKLTYFQRVPLDQEREEPLDELYYTTLYTDREIYQSTDEIRFWGNIAPRREGLEQPKQLEIALDDVYVQQVEVDEEGYFTGSLSFTALKQGAYSFAVRREQDKNYRMEYLSIGDYSKPAYIIDVQPDKDYFTADEEISFTIQANYFDGLPAANVALRANCYWLDLDNEEFVLDENGKASLRTKLKSDYEFTDWTPEQLYLYVNSAGEEEIEVQSECDFTVFPSRYAVDLSLDTPGQLKIRTAEIDHDRLLVQKEEKDKSDFDHYSKQAVDLPIHLRIYHEEWVETVVDTYYDSINKRSIPVKKGEWRTEEVFSRQLKTVDGEVVLENLPIEESRSWKSYYSYQISFDGDYGWQIQQRKRDYRSSLALNGSGNSYSFVPDDRYEKGSFAIGESLELGLYQDGKPVENTGRVLYTLLQERVIEQGVYGKENQTLTMKEEYLPNFAVFGAYFDGRHIYQVESYDIAYRYDERKLSIDITTDADNYQPGEEVTASFTVKDASGQPVPQARLCVGVVDESVFAVQPQDVDLIRQLYQTVFHYYPEWDVSYHEYNFGDYPMEGGRGGGDGEANVMRSEFVDTTAFEQLTCDENGKAQLTFTLPDNITDWRITAAAMKGKTAGDNIGHAIASKPFYLLPLVTESYLTEDDLTAAVGYSTLEQTSQPVNCTVSLLDLSGTVLDSKQVTLSKGKKSGVNFGKQPQGSYQILFDATAGEYSDMVLLPVQVNPTNRETTLAHSVSLEELTKLESVRYPVQVVFYDEQRQLYMDVLEWLMHQNGSRTEVITANYRASAAYAKLLPKESRWEVSYDKRLDETKGMRILPNAQPDAATTAKMLLAAPELVDRYYAEEFLGETLSDSPKASDSSVMTYVALAAMDQPVLLEIKSYLNDCDQLLTDSQKLWLGCALAKLGDFEGAQQVYRSVEERFTEKDGKLYHQDDPTATAAALVLHSLCQSQQAQPMAEYLLEAAKQKTLPEEMLPHLELLIWAKGEEARLQQLQPATLGWENSSGKQTQQLNEQGFFAKDFSYEEFSGIRFQAKKGEIFASVSYTTSAVPEQLEEQLDKTIIVRKTYQPMEDEHKVGRMTRVTVEVILPEDAPDGIYQIVDSIPAGMRLINNPNMQYRPSFWLQEEEQLLHGGFYRHTQDGVLRDEEEEENANRFETVYYLNGVMAGEYVAEGTVVTSPQGSYGFTPNQKIVIEP